jgi:Ser/Thr protein kinase RdoA (MazF antagonist)
MRFADLMPVPAPWMVDAGEAGLVGKALRDADPYLRARLTNCRPKRFRLGDGGACRGTYVLTISDGTTEEQVVVDARLHAPDGVRTPPGLLPFGDPGWTLHLDELGLDLRRATAGSTLDAFDDLVDPVRAPAVLTRVLRSGTRGDAEVVVTRARSTVLRHKPGSRCTFRVEVEASGPGADDFPVTVIAKIYSGDKGMIAERAMRALWASPMRSSTVAIAEPLGFDAERRILLQGPLAEDCTLKSLLVAWFAGADPTAWPRLVDLVRRTGAGLAELHGCGVEIGDEASIADELAEVHERAERVAAAFPEHRAILDTITGLVDDLAGASRPEAARPAHRSFRPAQILVAGDRLGFIDFDGFCQAEPAMDVALFCSMLRSIGMNKGVEDQAELLVMTPEHRSARLAEAEVLCDAFLDGYRSIGPVDPRRVALWETVYAAGLVVASWTKLKLHRLPNALHLLEEHLDRT